MVFVESIVKRVESEWESGLHVLIGHPCPLAFGQALIESLKELADLVFVATGAR